MTERQRDRQTDRHRQTDRQSKTYKQTERETERERERQGYRQRNVQKKDKKSASGSRPDELRQINEANSSVFDPQSYSCCKAEDYHQRCMVIDCLGTQILVYVINLMCNVLNVTLFN